jgi:hypothetical protein
MQAFALLGMPSAGLLWLLNSCWAAVGWSPVLLRCPLPDPKLLAELQLVAASWSPAYPEPRQGI